jgi:hypothetical protein
VHPFYFVFTHNKHFQLVVGGQSLAHRLYGSIEVWLHGVQCQVTNIAELVQFLQKTNKVVGIIGAAEREVQSVQLLIFHQDVLNNFAF